MSFVVKKSLTKLRDGRLHIYQQNDSKNWLWRIFINGKYLVRSTKTDNLAVAKSIAENEYDKLRFHNLTSDGTLAHSWEECERGFIDSLLHDGTTRLSRIKNYKVKLGIVRKYFHSFPVHTIKTKTIEDYLSWRRDTYKSPYSNYHSPTVANKTLRSDLLALRQVLKYAKREDWIKVIPEFPKLTVTPRPGGWFSQEELGRLFNLSHRWIWQSDGISAEELSQRRYTDCYMKWLLFTGMRVDEALQVRFEDVAVQDPDLSESLQDRCLFVKVKGGKLSYLKGTTEMIGLAPAVPAFWELQELTSNPQPTDLLFPVNPRERIQGLFEKAGLLIDERGQRRTAKSFRHTYIMKSLISGVDVYALARNCRTSVKMIEQHYGSYLTARMKQREQAKSCSKARSDRARSLAWTLTESVQTSMAG
jgi:integrase